MSEQRKRPVGKTGARNKVPKPKRAKPKPKATRKPAVLPDSSTPLMNIKHERFCWEFVRHNGNSTRAAVASGYSPRTASSYGSLLANKPSIRARIAAVTNLALANLHVDAQRTLAEVGRLAFIDMKDVVEKVETKLIQTGATKDGDPIYANKQVVLLRDWDQVDGTLIKEIGVRQGNVYVKVHDRTAFLKLLMQYHNLITGGGSAAGDAGDETRPDERTQVAFVQVVLNQYQQAAQTEEERAAVAKVLQLVQNKEVTPTGE